MAVATDQKAKARNRRVYHYFTQVIPATPAAHRADAKQADGQNGRFTPVTKWTFAFVLGLIVAGAVWYFWQPITEVLYLLSDQETVSAAIQSYGVLGPLALAAAQMLQVLVAVIPGHVFLVAAGYVYGFPAGFLLNITFVVVASQLGFLLARRYGRPLVNRLVRPELVDKWEQIAEERGVMFFTVAFLLPVFPTDAMNFVAGLTGMSPRKFLIANVLGRVPSAIMLTLIGSHGLELPQAAWWIMGVLVAVVYVGGRLVIARIEQRYTQKKATAQAAAD